MFSILFLSYLLVLFIKKSLDPLTRALFTILALFKNRVSNINILNSISILSTHFIY